MAPSGPSPLGSTCDPARPAGPSRPFFLVVEPRRAEILPYLPPPSSTQVSPEEVQKLVAAFEDPSGLQAGGIYLCGEKHMFIRSDDRFIAGKRVRCQFFFASARPRSEDSPPARPFLSRRRINRGSSRGRRPRAW